MPGVVLDQTRPYILIVDDETFNTLAFKQSLLTHWNLKVDIASSGEEAIMKCQQRMS